MNKIILEKISVLPIKLIDITEYTKMCIEKFLLNVFPKIIYLSS